MHVHPVALSCTFLCTSERNNLLILLQSITAIKNALKCIRLTLRGTLGTLFPPHKCFSYCPFVPLQNGVDACETERDTRGPESSLFAAVLTGRVKNHSFVPRKKEPSSDLMVAQCNVKRPEVCAV